VDSPSFWSSFPHDPRDPSYAGLRASDQDRSVVHQALAEAYAEGRLDPDELDERSARVVAAKTLGELPPVVADLLPARATGPALVQATPNELQQRAERAWREDLRRAVGVFLLPSLICWIVWLSVNANEWATSHVWPLWVMLGTGIPLLRTTLRRGEIIDDHRRSLERKQAKEQRRRELGP
jgi:hypothetical protein